MSARLDACPHCKASLIGAPVAVDHLQARGYPPPLYRREIGYSVHDYIQFWVCPDCAGTWNRWDVTSPQYERAEKLRFEFAAVEDGAEG